MKLYLKIVTLLLFQLYSSGYLAQECSKIVNVFFDFDKDIVKSKYQVQLQSAIDSIGIANITHIEISGHTDSKGSIDYNIDLANRRKDNVKVLIPKLVLDVLIENSFGELRPFKNADYEDNKKIQNNRRVEVLIKFKCDKVIIKNIHNLTQKEKDQIQLEEIKASFSPQPNTFEITNFEEQKIETPNGTLLIIPSQSFVRNDGSSPDKVYIYITEFYDILSIISSDLTTYTSNGELLETAGMVNLKATDKDGNLLELSNPLVIGFPYQKGTLSKDGMQLYDGQKTDNGITWNLSQLPNYQNPADIDMSKIKLNRPNKVLMDTTYNNIFEKSMAEQALSILTGRTPIALTGADIDTSEINKVSEYGRYFHNVTNLGFVNCDRSALKGLGGNIIKVQIQRNNEAKGAEITFLVFKDINSLANPDFTPNDSDLIVFSKIPEGLDVIFVSLVVNNGEIYFCKKELITSNKIETPTYQIVSEEEYKQSVKNLIKL